jgi:exodeoxyribonuclease VII large subunit
MDQFQLFSPLAPPSWSVTDLTRYLRDLLQSDEFLQDLWVQGEISNCARPNSGHLYFTIKDSGSSLRCVMWRNNVARLKTLPSDGDAVEVHGAISIYEVSGQYQLYADLIRPAGFINSFYASKPALKPRGCLTHNVNDRSLLGQDASALSRLPPGRRYVIC